MKLKKMKLLRTLTALPAILAACASSHTTPALAPDRFTPIAGDDGIVLWSAGANGWFADAKDQKLCASLSMLDARLAELPEELSQSEFPIEAIQLVLDVIGSPMSLRIALEKDAQPGKLSFRAQLTVAPGAEAASTEMAERLSNVLERYGVPTLGKAEAMHGLQMVPLGPIAAYHGALGDKVVIAVNDVKTDELALGSLDLPAGVKPFFAFKFDYGQIGDAMEQAVVMASAMSGSDGPDLSGLTSSMWLRGTTVQGGMGFGPDRLYGSTRTRGFVSAATERNLMPDGPLGTRELALVPKDASWAMLGRVNPKGYVGLMRDAIRAQAGAHGLPVDTDPFELIKNFIGLDLEADVFHNLGQTVGAYTSDATGGGGWTSLVAFVAVTDEAKMRETLKWAETEANSAAATHAKGYAALRKWTSEPLHSALVSSESPGACYWTSGTHQLTTLTFPGLPVPLELSYALEGGYLFAAMSPQALIKALDQAHGGHDGLADNPHLSGERLAGAYSLTFIDTPKLARDGYSLVGMGCAAIANAMRSKTDVAREPGMILPPFLELESGAKAFVQIGRVEENDFVVTWHADRSMLVNACGVSGMMGGTSGLLGLVGLVGVMPKLAEKIEASHGEHADDAMDSEGDEDALDELDTMPSMDTDDAPADGEPAPMPVPDKDPK